MPSNKQHRVEVAQHTYGYWRAQCMTCGTIQNWRTEMDADWWAEKHEETANADH